MSTPKCHEFEAFLELAVERKDRLSDAPGAGFSTHLSVCGACHLKWDEARALQRAIDDWTRRLPEVDLVASVLQRWQDSRSATQSDLATATNVAAEHRSADNEAAKAFSVEPGFLRRTSDDRSGEQASFRPPRRVSESAARAVLALTFGVLLFVGWRVAVVSVPANVPERPVASGPNSPADAEKRVPIATNESTGRSPESGAPSTSPSGQSEAEDVEITGLFREAGTAYL